VNLSVLRYEISDQVARIAIHNPPVNALDTRFLEEFEAVLDRLSQPGEARAVVLRSDCPGFFSAGDDVRELGEISPDMLAALPRAHALLDALESLPLPTIAAINGHALGGGLELALTCVEMMFKGLQLTPEEAERIGLVNAVFPQSELEERVQDYAARLARQATSAIARIKGCVHTGFYQGTAKGLAEERRAVVENFESPDVREGVDAFLSGRKPQFRG
jgi:enoyl-CoA hydratase/carnithine racemase